MAIRGKFVNYNIQQTYIFPIQKPLSIIALYYCKEELNKLDIP